MFFLSELSKAQAIIKEKVPDICAQIVCASNTAKTVSTNRLSKLLRRSSVAHRIPSLVLASYVSNERHRGDEGLMGMWYNKAHATLHCGTYAGMLCLVLNLLYGGKFCTAS